ncbi:MAG: glutamate 5-kinase, partial [Deltaproteobacteria bacterium]|nr:glutamate 5-kinase [Deltaproteobacteria bacterium]
PRLIAIYNDFFREHRITCAQALLTRSDFGDRERYLSIRNVLEGLLRLNILPIINENDVVASDALTFGDNDFLSAAVASLVGADKLFLLTSTDGFYQGGDPNVNKKARLVDEVQEITPEMWADCQPTLSLGGRGGMYSKLKSAQLASSHGIEVVVASGKEPGVVSRIMEGERLGTRFLPTGKRMRSYRLWLRFGAITNGTIAIDAGAEKALRNNKSLLPAGIVSMEGDFRKGEVVAIHNPAGQQLGMGVVEISSDELRDMISGSREMERSREAVHKDRLLMLQG